MFHATTTATIFHAATIALLLTAAAAVALPKAEIPLHPPELTGTQRLQPVVEQVASSIKGHTTYHLSLELGATLRDVYAVYGEKGHLMRFPPAFQTGTPFGAHIGGVAKELIKLNPDSAFDSWLTIDITDGDKHSRLGTENVAFDQWSAGKPLVVDNGAVFMMNPNAAPAKTGGNVLVAQLTLPSARHFEATVCAQGHTTQSLTDTKYPGLHMSWDEKDITFTIGRKAPISLHDARVVEARKQQGMGEALKLHAHLSALGGH